MILTSFLGTESIGGRKIRNDTGENKKYYSEKLQDGRILEVYKGIMSFMSELKRKLDKTNPDFEAESIYFFKKNQRYTGMTGTL